MTDFISGYSDVFYSVMQTERIHEAESRSWLRKLRDLQRRDRNEKRRHAGRNVIVSEPKHLAGVHKVWL